MQSDISLKKHDLFKNVTEVCSLDWKAQNHAVIALNSIGSCSFTPGP